MLRSLAFYVALVASPELHAGELITNLNPDLAQIFEDTKIAVYIQDEISDGCWRNPNSSKTAVELVLIQNKLGTISDDEGVFGKQVWLEGLGYGSGNNCVVTVALKLYSITFNKRVSDKNEIDFYHNKPVHEIRFILSGPKSDMNNRIRDSFRDAAESLVVSSVKERKKIIENIGSLDLSPELKSRFISLFDR